MDKEQQINMLKHRTQISDTNPIKSRGVLIVAIYKNVIQKTTILVA